MTFLADYDVDIWVVLIRLFEQQCILTWLEAGTNRIVAVDCDKISLGVRKCVGQLFRIYFRKGEVVRIFFDIFNGSSK